MQKKITGDRPESIAIANREVVQVRHDLRGSAPFVAVVSLVLTLIIGGVGLFTAEADYGWQFDYFEAGSMVVVGLTCTRVFLRLLHGKFETRMNLSLLVASAIGCYGAGDKWYVVVLISAMAYASMLVAVHSVVGSSAQIVQIPWKQSKHSG